MTKAATKEPIPARTIKVTEVDRIFTLKLKEGCRMTFGPAIPAPPRPRAGDRYAFDAGPRVMEYALRIYGPGGKEDLVAVYTQVRQFRVIDLVEEDLKGTEDTINF